MALGLAGFLPYSGLLGSQFLFFSASAASCSAVRWGTLSMKGKGTLVMYSATPKAKASPINRPTIMPRKKPPRWEFMLDTLLITSSRVR